MPAGNMYVALSAKNKIRKNIKEVLQISIAVFYFKKGLIYIQNARIIYKIVLNGPFPAEHFKTNNQGDEPNRK